MRGGSIEVFVVGLATLLIVAVLLVRGVLELLLHRKGGRGVWSIRDPTRVVLDAAGSARPCHHPQPREGGGWMLGRDGQSQGREGRPRISTQDYRANGQTR